MFNRSPRSGSIPDLSTSAEDFLKTLTSVIGPDQLLEMISARLRESLSPDAVYIVLHEPITTRYIGRKAKGDASGFLRELNFSRTDHLMKWLNVNRCPFDVGKQREVLRYLGSNEQALLSRGNIALVVPLVVLNRLTGAIFLTGRGNGIPYSPREIEVLSMLAGRSALAIEHVAMNELQEDRLRKILHADKLATAGELAAGAAHEIRNPLTSIRSTMQYVKDGLTPEKRALVEGLIGEVDRIDRIIDGLLSFGRSGELHLQTLDVADLLEQTLLLLEAELKKHSSEVVRRYEVTRRIVQGDASQLKQVFLNILLNAIQSLDSGGSITLTVAEPETRPHWISVAVRDTGSGIPAKDLGRVFDPFYTTKTGGTGLGLSISYGIVSKHGGDIGIDSRTDGPDRGTRVTVYLPEAPPGNGDV